MFLKVRSRHPSHDGLRNQIRVSQPTVVRFGSFTEMSGYREINSVNACMTSSNKRLMKEAFTAHNVKTALWCFPQNQEDVHQWINDHQLQNKQFIIKSLRGSRGRGLYKFNTVEDVINFYNRRGYGGHILELFYNYNREYRLHVSKDGCFYTCRKMLRSDIDTANRWYRNDSNSTWIVEENPLFDKPVNWNTIVQECVKALAAVGLDLGACDVRVQSRTTSNDRVRQNPDFIICEINSAPSFGEITLTKYKQIIQICVDSLDTAAERSQTH